MGSMEFTLSLSKGSADGKVPDAECASEQRQPLPAVRPDGSVVPPAGVGQPAVWQEAQEKQVGYTGDRRFAQPVRGAGGGGV